MLPFCESVIITLRFPIIAFKGEMVSISASADTKGTDWYDPENQVLEYLTCKSIYQKKYERYLKRWLEDMT